MDITTLSSYITTALTLFTWRDVIEIFLFSSTFYHLALWLKKDHEKNLLTYFYSYCLLTLGSYALQLSTITYCLVVISPAVIMLFMFMHQNILQRNIIALKNITHTTQPMRDWLEILLRGSLRLLNTNKEALILIEHTDTLASYIQPTYLLDAPLTQGITDLIFDDQLYSPKHMIWIASNGTIRGIKTTWRSRWQTSAHADPHAWIDDALAHTTNTDALVLHLNPATHTVTIAQRGTLYENLTLDQAAQLIIKHIDYPIQSLIKKGFEYDITNQKNRMAQRTP